MKEYIVKRYLKADKFIKKSITLSAEPPPDDKRDVIAFAWKKNGTYQIYTKQRGKPNSTMKLYKDFFGDKYNLNRPYPTREACEEHMYYLSLLRKWIDPSADKFRMHVAIKLCSLAEKNGAKQLSNKEVLPPRKGWEGFFFQEGIIRDKRELDILADFAVYKVNITPRRWNPDNVHMRKFFFHLCKVCKIDPASLGFERSLFPHESTAFKA